MKPSTLYGMSSSTSIESSDFSDSALPSLSSTPSVSPSVTPTPPPTLSVTPSVTPTPPPTPAPTSTCTDSPSTPSIVSFPTVSAHIASTSVSRTPGIVNPLVSAGLISPDLIDILVTSSDDAALPKKRTKIITGARDLTSSEYAEMLRKEQRKKEEAEKEKQARKEEREKKKKEREQKKKERESCRAARGRGRGRGRRLFGHGKRKTQMDGNDSVSEASNSPPPTSSPEISEPESDGEAGPSTSSREPESDGEAGPSTSSRPHRQRTLPSRFRRDSSDSDNNDGSICVLCDSNEPEGLATNTVFWIDCDKCGYWAHNFSAFGSNTASQRFLCSKCSQ